MHTVRAIIAVLIALAIAAAPIGAATVTSRSVAIASNGAGLVQPAAVVDMADCDKMMGRATGDLDCACCDPKGVCPPDFCPLKIFKVFDGLVACNNLGVMSISHLVLAPLRRPPDWITGPQPPPPRA